MRALAAHRKARALQMARRDIQHARIGAMVNRQLHADFGNIDIPHDARAVYVEQAAVLRQLRALGQRFVFRKRIAQRPQRGVVIVGLRKQVAVILLRHRRQRILIRADRARLMQRIPVIAHRGIQ